jgi:hypothetical protein
MLLTSKRSAPFLAAKPALACLWRVCFELCCYRVIAGSPLECFRLGQLGAGLNRRELYRVLHLQRE